MICIKGLSKPVSGPTGSSHLEFVPTILAVIVGLVSLHQESCESCPQFFLFRILSIDDDDEKKQEKTHPVDGSTRPTLTTQTMGQMSLLLLFLTTLWLLHFERAAWWRDVCLYI